LKKALISKIEPRETVYRVAQVEEASNIFPVDESWLAWIDCPDNIIADQQWFDPSDNTFKDIPPAKLVEQPTTIGTQTI